MKCVHALGLGALLMGLWGSAHAVVAPMSVEEMMEAADLVVDAEVMDTVCVGMAIETETNLTTAYIATLEVLAVIKGEAVDEIQIPFEDVIWYEPPASCAGGDLTHGRGEKGRYYLSALEEEGQYTLLSWSAFEEAGDSDPSELPACESEDPLPADEGVEESDGGSVPVADAETGDGSGGAPAVPGDAGPLPEDGLDEDVLDPDALNGPCCEVYDDDDDEQDPADPREGEDGSGDDSEDSGDVVADDGCTGAPVHENPVSLAWGAMLLLFLAGRRRVVNG